MSRSKKSRKPGAYGAPEVIVTRNRSESDTTHTQLARLSSTLGLESIVRISKGRNRSEERKGREREREEQEREREEQQKTGNRKRRREEERVPNTNR